MSETPEVSEHTLPSNAAIRVYFFCFWPGGGGGIAGLVWSYSLAGRLLMLKHSFRLPSSKTRTDLKLWMQERAVKGHFETLVIRLD